MSLNSHIGKTWITRIHSLTKRGDQFLSRTGEKLPIDTDTEEGLVIPSTSNSDDDHKPSHPAPPPPGAPPPVPPKNSPGSKNTGGKSQKTTRPDEKPSTTISPEPDTRGSVFRSTRPRYNLRPRKRHDIPEASSSQLPHDLPPEGPSPELETEDNEPLYATDGESP